MARTAPFSPSPPPASRWSAQEVAGHAFGTARRGYDPNEVRNFLEQLAAELAAAARREEELRAQLVAAEEAARHPVLDEAALSEALGQRVAAVLRNAHEEAAKIAQQAEEDAAAALRDAQAHANEVRVGAESQAVARTAEAEFEANALRQRAREEATAILETAKAEGEAQTARAKEQGRAMLDQAQDARRRVLADMAQRRRTMTEQIERFRAARDEIAGSVMGVRHSLDGIVDDLGRADDAARAAATRPAHADAAPPATERELVDEAVRAAEELGVASGTFDDVAAAPDEVAPVPAAAPDEVVPARDEVTLLPAAAPDEVAPARDEVTLLPRAAPDEVAPVRDEVTVLPAAAPDEVAPVRDDVTVLPYDAGEHTPPSALRVDDIATAVSHRDADTGSASPGAVEVPPAPGLDSAEALDAPQSGGDHGAGPDVEKLFARLRARHGDDAPDDEPGADDAPAAARPATSASDDVHGAPDAAAGDSFEAARDGAVATDGGPGVDAPEGQSGDDRAGGALAPGDVEAPAGTPADAEPVSPGSDAAALAARDEALGPIVTAMARRLKRALQDDQNRLLDRLRQGTGEWSDALLADETAERTLYSKAADRGVRDSIAAGTELARFLVGGRHSKTAAPDQRTVEAITEDLAATIVALLRRRLEGGEIPDAAERIGAAYREWRGERIEQLAEDRAVEAFHAGVLAGAARSKGLHWVRSETGPGCADCEDNALAGDVPRGDEFPTGHRYPPAHPGCRCLVVPTAS